MSKAKVVLMVTARHSRHATAVLSKKVSVRCQRLPITDPVVPGLSQRGRRQPPGTKPTKRACEAREGSYASSQEAGVGPVCRESRPLKTGHAHALQRLALTLYSEQSKDKAYHAPAVVASLRACPHGCVYLPLYWVLDTERTM